MNRKCLTTVVLFGLAALIAGGCAPLTDDGGSSTQGCLAAVVSNGGTAIAINRASTQLPSGTTGTTSQLAEAFLAPSTQTIPEVQVMLQVVTPAGFQVSSTVTVSIQQDAITSTGGTSQTPSSPQSAPLSNNGVTATASLPAANISTTTPTFYDFCFAGATGANCGSGITSGSGTTTTTTKGVTLTSGQIYWVVVKTDAAGSATSYVEWFGSKNLIPNYFGEVLLNNGSWSFVSGTTSPNFNFNIKVGC